MGNILDREEYIEQAYFFRAFRERLASQMATQEILENVHEEILSTTRLPYAIQFLATELKHSGYLSSGFAKLPQDRKSTRLNSSHIQKSRMPSSA